MAHALCNLLQAGAEAVQRVRGGDGESDLGVEMCVIGIAVEVDPMFADDTDSILKILQLDTCDLCLDFEILVLCLYPVYQFVCHIHPT